MPERSRWRCAVGVRGPDGSLVELVPGDIIGRAWNAAMQLDDPRISEAHAMVSLRDGGLWVLALRRRVRVGGESHTELELAAGQELQLAEGVALNIEYLLLPDDVLGLTGPGLGTRPLNGVASLRLRPRPELLPRFDEGAALTFWSTGLGIRARYPEGAAFDVTPGQRLEVEGSTFTVVALPGPQAGAARTRGDGGLDAPLLMLCRYDSVHFVRLGCPVVVITGIPARLVTELALIARPVAWQAVAVSLWPEADDNIQLRRRWDVQLARLRARLRAAGIRGDLISPDGKGNFELVLGAEDRVIDEA